ncbi:MAG: hypothetical protein U0T83_01380 [Bacteriovoracaceae bacterium]
MSRNLFSSFLIFSILSSNSFALETDQYIVWNSDFTLKDSTEALNEYMNKNIETVLASINQNPSNLNPDKCNIITNKIIKSFQTITPPEDKIEIEMHTNAKVDLYPKVTSFSEYYKNSIYRYILVLVSKVFAFVSPSVKINNVYIGVDKLGHFISQGKEYFDLYKKEIDDNKSIYEAEVKAINLGIQQEYGKYGIFLSGVFSFADLEANYQGLKFSRSLCFDSNSPYIKFDLTENKWIQVKKIDMRRFVNPNWDESYNNSYFSPDVAPKIVPVIKANYCEIYKSKKIQNIRAAYAKIATPSFSKLYLLKQILIGEIVKQNQYSIETICTESI